jgi:HEAT repeat protein
MELDPTEYRKQIRHLLDENPRAFLSAAVEVLKRQADTRGAQFVASLLVLSGLLLPALCDPSLSHQEALDIARLAMRADSTTDVMLGRASADRVASSRVIRILEKSAGGRDLVPLLLRLLRQPNPYLRSKAVLMLARDTHNVSWVRKTLADADPRIRANAVEAIWGVDTAEARELLRSLRTDANNRVAGNALLGLYRLGDAGVIPEIMAISTHEEPVFRATAAWVMGETGHPRFANAISGMLRDPHPLPRRAALTAMGRINAAAVRARQLPVRRLGAYYSKDGGSGGLRRVGLAVALLPGAEESSILPTHVFLAEDGRAVHHYQMGKPAAGEQSLVMFLIPNSEAATPSPWSRYALACLNLKRPEDAWSCLPYASGVLQSGDPPAEEIPSKFEAEEPAVREAFTRLPLLTTRTDIWHAIWRSVQPEAAGTTGRRHLIICNDSPSDLAPGPGLISNVKDSGILLQVVSSVPNPALESLCQQVHGVFLLGRSPGDLAAQVEQAYLNLQVHYEITYEPVVERAKLLKIMLCHPAGWGEATVPVPSFSV